MGSVKTHPATASGCIRNSCLLRAYVIDAIGQASVGLVPSFPSCQWVGKAKSGVGGGSEGGKCIYTVCNGSLQQVVP